VAVVDAYVVVETKMKMPASCESGRELPVLGAVGAKVMGTLWAQIRAIRTTTKRPRHGKAPHCGAFPTSG
jgi:hypothetical protein